MSVASVGRHAARQVLLASSCLLALGVAPGAQAQHQHAAVPGAAESYGQVHFPVSCSPEAQERFDRATAMLHSFHFPATGKAFTELAAAEPGCAMA